MKPASLYSIVFTCVVSACSSAQKPCPAPESGDIVYVTGRAWHTEIGIPVEELGEHLAFYRSVFPDARVIMFGYGKKTFFTAPATSVREYCLGPIPGPAAIHAVALSVTPPEAYPPENTVTLALPPGGSKALSEYIWEDLDKNDDGEPYIVSRSKDPDGLFYAADSEYTILHTCNSWAADALHAAGLPISGDGVMFSGPVMEGAVKASQSQCVSPADSPSLGGH